MSIYKIYKNSILVNRIISDEDFVSTFCREEGCTYEYEANNSGNGPTEMDEQLLVNLLIDALAD